MAACPDVTIPDDIRSTPGDDRVSRFNEDPLLVVVEWTDDLKGPQSTRVDADIGGYTQQEIEEHRTKYDAWMGIVYEHLAAGRLVVVRGWNPEATTIWDSHSISKFKGSMDQLIEYQGHVISSSHFKALSHVY